MARKLCVLVCSNLLVVLADDPGLTVHWKDRFLEVRGDSIPGGPIRTPYLEA